MIVEINKDNSRWIAVDVTSVYLERTEVGLNLVVRTAGDYGSYTYPLERVGTAKAAYEKLAGGFLKEYVTGEPVVISVSGCDAIEVPAEQLI